MFKFLRSKLRSNNSVDGFSQRERRITDIAKFDNFFRFAGVFFLQEQAEIIDKKMDSKRLYSLVTCLRSVQGQSAFTFLSIIYQIKFLLYLKILPAKSNKAQGKSI